GEARARGPSAGRGGGGEPGRDGGAGLPGPGGVLGPRVRLLVRQRRVVRRADAAVGGPEVAAPDAVRRCSAHGVAPPSPGGAKVALSAGAPPPRDVSHE